MLSIFQEVVLRFENQGDTTTHLEELKRENDKQIARLNEEKEKLQVEFEEMKYSGEAKLSRYDYREISNIRRTLVGKKIVDNSDVVGASPVGAAPTTSSFSTKHLVSIDCAKTTARRDKKHLSFEIWCNLY